MKGVIFEQAGAEPQVVDHLEKPPPASDQILVKSIYTAINPVDSAMSAAGFLVTAWPFVPGCDAAGVVVETGDGVGGKFKVGDEFLMDAARTIPKPKNISLQQAATIGVGALTAALGLFNGLKLPFPDLESLTETSKDASAQSGAKAKEDWVVVLGGASSVGKYGIQMAIAAGYKVTASCSASSAKLVQDLGAVPFDYKKPLEHQTKEVMSITSNKPFRIFDATGTQDDLVKDLFKNLSGAEKLFATTSPSPTTTEIEEIKTYTINLGTIGRAESTHLNADIEKFIPTIVALLETELVLPNRYDIVGSGGLQDVIDALKYQQKGAGGSNKVLAKIQDL